MISKVLNYLPAIVALLVFILACKVFISCTKSKKTVVEKFEEEEDQDDDYDEELDLGRDLQKFRKVLDTYQNDLDSRMSSMRDKNTAECYVLKDKFAKLEKILLRAAAEDENEGGQLSESEKIEENEETVDEVTDDSQDNVDVPPREGEKEMRGEEKMRKENTSDSERQKSKRIRRPRNAPLEIAPGAPEIEDANAEEDNEEVVESFVEGISSCTTANCYRYN